MQAAVAGTIQRISPGDLTQLATDVGPVPMQVAAVLVLDPSGRPLDLAAAQREFVERTGAVARMRQRLVSVPRGLGRPVWVDDPAFDPAEHVTTRRCPDPGDLQALLDLAAIEVTRPLPRFRPLWRAVYVTGLPDGQLGLVLVLHHVLADGIGGLALLAALVDPGSPAPPDRTVRPAPTPRELAAERAASLARGVRTLRQAAQRLARARAELAVDRPHLAPRTSLNAPTGAWRHAAVVDIGLEVVRAAAHRHAATVNDVLLVAVTDALAAVLAERGEAVPELVVSVPIAARQTATVGQLGNAVGVMPVTVAVSGSLTERLVRVASGTAAQRQASRARRGASASLVGPAFRGLAALGAFRWMIDRQRLVNTFLTNLRGPAEPLQLHGATVRSITPLTVTAGNVTCAFAALSYAGTLRITVITDPQRVPEHGRLALALAGSLRRLCEVGPDDQG